MAEVEPQYASDYDDCITVAVKSVLLEIGQILGSYKGEFAVIGGAVPWLLLNKADMSHIGTLDVDLSLDAEALGSGEYARLVESLVQRGYRRHERGSRFQVVRTAPVRDGGPSMEQAGFIRREERWDKNQGQVSNRHHFDGLTKEATPYAKEITAERAKLQKDVEKRRTRKRLAPAS